MKNHILEIPLIRQPFNMLNCLAPDRVAISLCGIARFGLDENNHTVGNFILRIQMRDFGKGFGMSFPTKVFGLETQKSHGRLIAISNSLKSFVGLSCLPPRGSIRDETARLQPAYFYAVRP